MRKVLPLLWLLAGCAAPPPAPFQLGVTAFSDEGMPLSGVEVRVDGKLVGRTDDEGRLSTALSGSAEGQRVRVEAATPAGMRALTDAKLVALERMLLRGPGGVRGAPLEFNARFAPAQRHYAVLVDVGLPDAPVQIYGVPRVRTNSAGVAMFLTPGTPGDSLEVAVTPEAGDLIPKRIAQTFTLRDHADVFVLTGAFARVAKHAHRPHRPHPLLPHNRSSF